MSIKDYPARLTTGYYRVRETWDDAASQLGGLPAAGQCRGKSGRKSPDILCSPMKVKPSIRSRSPALRKQRSSPGHSLLTKIPWKSPRIQSLAIKILTAMRHPRRLKKRRSIRKQPLKTQKELQSPVKSVPPDEETGQETDGTDKEFPEAVEYDYDW